MYETLPGWGTEIDAASRIEELPQQAHDYIRFVEEFVDVHVSFVSVGPQARSDRRAAPRRVHTP